MAEGGLGGLDRVHGDLFDAGAGLGIGAPGVRFRGLALTLAPQAGGDDQGATEDHRGGGHQVAAGQQGLFP